VLALLLDILASNDNSSNALDDGHWLAGLVAALGQLKLRNTTELAKVCLCEILYLSGQERETERADVWLQACGGW
jgi:hypothetical protein